MTGSRATNTHTTACIYAHTPTTSHSHSHSHTTPAGHTVLATAKKNILRNFGNWHSIGLAFFTFFHLPPPLVWEGVTFICFSVFRCIIFALVFINATTAQRSIHMIEWKGRREIPWNLLSQEAFRYPVLKFFF
jgi:hypothetical protein